MRTLPEYSKVYPYDITRTIRQHGKDIDAVRRASKGSEEYAYTVTWTGSTGSATLGNGTLVGFYRRVGSGVNFRVQLTWGSTTVGPTGIWILSLPIPPDCSQAEFVGSSLVFDTSATAGYPGSCLITTESGANPEGRVYAWHAGNVGRTSNAIPITWASADIWRVSGWYTVFEEDIEIPE